MALPTLASINSALGSLSSPGVRKLTVRPGENNTFEVHGEAESIAAMQEAFRALKSKLGDATGVMNKIQVVKAAPAAAAPQAAAPAGREPAVPQFTGSAFGFGSGEGGPVLQEAPADEPKQK